MARAESQQIFINAFQDEMHKAGYIIKENKFFKIDLQHKWMKVLFMGFWAQNHLYRICLDIIPFTSEFDIKMIREDTLFEINSISRSFTKPSIPSEISLDSFYPTFENITKTFELYKMYIHTEFCSAASFDECIQYLSLLKKFARLPEFEELEMMYACLYLDKITEAYEHACIYKNSIIVQEKSIRESYSKQLNAISAVRLREDTVRSYEISLGMIHEQMERIDNILSSFENHQLEPLMNEVQKRIDASTAMCLRFFTKREQGMLGI